MSEIENILGRDTLREISRSAGDVSEQEVSDVLEALLPLLQESRDSGEAAQRAAELRRDGGDRGLDVTSLLPLLLGGNGGGLLSSLSQSTGVNGNSIQSILKVAAPLLLLYLLNSNQTQPQTPSQPQQSNMLGLFSALLGGGQQSQPVQQPQQQGSLLGSLLGLDAQPQQTQQPQQQGSLLGSLLGLDAQPQQTQQPQQQGSLLGSLLGLDAQPQQTQQQGSLLGSLLGGSSGGSDLLSSFVNLLADNGSGRETPEQKEPAGKTVKKAASTGTAKKAKTTGATPKTGGAKKTTAAARKPAATGKSGK